MKLFLQRLNVILRDVGRHVKYVVTNDLDFPSSQNPNEIAQFCSMASKVGPKIVMEIGVAECSNAIYLCENLPTVKTFIGIDLYVRNRFNVRGFIRNDCSIHLKNGRSENCVKWVGKVLKGKEIDVLFIDGDHTYLGVCSDYMNYRHFVRRGGIIAFHDIVPDKREKLQKDDPKGNVPAFWKLLSWHDVESRGYEIIDDPNQDGMGIGVIEV